jgi:hypothetical protein
MWSMMGDSRLREGGRGGRGTSRYVLLHIHISGARSARRCSRPLGLGFVFLFSAPAHRPDSHTDERARVHAHTPHQTSGWSFIPYREKEKASASCHPHGGAVLSLLFFCFIFFGALVSPRVQWQTEVMDRVTICTYMDE